jgi:hypothetical protein
MVIGFVLSPRSIRLEGLRRQRQFSTVRPNCTNPLAGQFERYSWTIGLLLASRPLLDSFAAA